MVQIRAIGASSSSSTPSVNPFTVAETLPPPMSIQQLTDAFSAISYKPGWSWTVVMSRHEGAELHIATTMQDSSNPGRSIDLNIVSPLPPMRYAWQVSDWLTWRLKRIEVHEVLEWLQKDGFPIENPHDGIERT